MVQGKNSERIEHQEPTNSETRPLLLTFEKLHCHVKYLFSKKFNNNLLFVLGISIIPLLQL